MTEIPERVVEKIKTFMREGSTGSVTLHFNEGRVSSYDIRETGAIRRTKTVDTPQQAEYIRTR